MLLSAITRPFPSFTGMNQGTIPHGVPPTIISHRKMALRNGPWQSQEKVNDCSLVCVHLLNLFAYLLKGAPEGIITDAMGKPLLWIVVFLEKDLPFYLILAH